MEELLVITGRDPETSRSLGPVEVACAPSVLF